MPSGERSGRTSPWPAFSAQRKAHKAASAAPCRVPVDQPVKVGPATTPRLACIAHTSMGRCDNQSGATSIVEFQSRIPKDRAGTREPTGLATRKNPPSFIHCFGGAGKGRSLSS
jgi:hypothetical protein